MSYIILAGDILPLEFDICKLYASFLLNRSGELQEWLAACSSKRRIVSCFSWDTPDFAGMNLTALLLLSILLHA